LPFIGDGALARHIAPRAATLALYQNVSAQRQRQRQWGGDGSSSVASCGGAPRSFGGGVARISKYRASLLAPARRRSA